MIHFTSDTHFGHKFSLQFPNCKRNQFEDINVMNIHFVNCWNSVVKPEDSVYHLGDFAYKFNTCIFHWLSDHLNGKIHLIKGNHDGQVLKENQKNPLFESVQDYFELNTVFKDKEYNLVLMHYPIESWKNMLRGTIHLHGHTHNSLNTIYNRKDIYRLDVSVDSIYEKFGKYRPISLEEVLTYFGLNNEEVSGGDR